MNDEAALLAAIHGNPADEAAWLALGDWLEEQTQAEQAELLRLTKQLLRAPIVSGRGKSKSLAAHKERQERVQELLRAGVVPYWPQFTNSVGMTFSLVPPGSFLMGSPPRETWRPTTSEELHHPVEITRPYYLGTTPVTQEQFQAVVDTNPSAFAPGGARAAAVQGLDTRAFPVDTVSWHEARRFCAALTARDQGPSGGPTYRLPTEAEWEYACRAGTLTAFVFGSTWEPSWGNTSAGGPNRATPVGTYPPNPLGLFDMHGTVFEWCFDSFSQRYYEKGPQRDPPGPTRGTTRVLRGGSWNNPSTVARSADRNRDEPEKAYPNYGFRVVRKWAPS
jgi:uncharacterized protein (TIGR02996 family)